MCPNGVYIVRDIIWYVYLNNLNWFPITPSILLEECLDLISINFLPQSTNPKRVIRWRCDVYIDIVLLLELKASKPVVTKQDDDHVDNVEN
jgi:hypothetical protein